jgi:hypothetical protein
MRALAFTVIFLSSIFSHAQTATVDITLRPAGSFKVKSTEVRGFATQKAGVVEAKNIVVGLKNVTTGISLRDKHTREYLEVEKYPEAIRLSAVGKDGKGEGSKKTPRVKKSAADDPRITRYRKLMKIAGLRIVTNKELDAMKSQKSKYDFMKQIFIDAGL